MIYLFIDGAGVGRLFEATGAPSVVNSCFSLLRKGAKMVLVGK
jgi:threonine dehydrogenase-like Zn-dependent dehydrogenase